MKAKATTSDRSVIWKYLLLPWMAVVTVLAYVWAQDLQSFPDPPTARIIFWHVPMAMLGVVWFTIGAVRGLRFLGGQGWVWNTGLVVFGLVALSSVYRAVTEGFAAGNLRGGVISLIIAAVMLWPCLVFRKRLQTQDRMAGKGVLAEDPFVKHANEIGLICTVLATVTGSVFADRQWNTWWNWDPKQVAITVLIAVYVAYFVLRASVEHPEQRARISAVYSILGAIATPFIIYVIPNMEFVQSNHPGGKVITTGLDPKWRTIYWMATFGFLGITIWLYQLRLRVSLLEDWLATRALEAELRTADSAAPRLEAVRKPAQ